jgi:indolepyruvate ferredoxin oxidoreductase beta subunit
MGGWYGGDRPLTIAIVAMGGEGGGVLADWIVAMAEGAGHIAQNTSVAGVAQRTGATVYYVEIYSVDAGTHDDPPAPMSEPVLSLFPAPGEVDVVIASELMEAGRAIQRGFCTPDRTTLIASTNRVYAITERAALGDGTADSDELLRGAHQAAQRFIAADFMELAQRAGSVISASLFGALCRAAVLPYTRDQFEQAIRASGKGVDASMRAFEAGYDAAGMPPPMPRSGSSGSSSTVSVSIGRRPPSDPVHEAAEEAVRREQERNAIAAYDPAELVGSGLRAQAERTGAFPAAARSMLLHGVVRTAVYQGPAYADSFLDRIEAIAELDSDGDGQAALTVAAARHVALWMCYQDTVHVAHQKIRRARLAGIRAEAGAAEGQLLQVREYLHPQLEEIIDTLPAVLGRPLLRQKWFAKAVAKLTRDGMVVNTTSALGFSMLWVMAQARPLRPRSLRFGREQDAIDRWLRGVIELAGTDQDLAREVLECQGLLKGYGQTLAHGSESFALLMSILPQLESRPHAAGELARLRAAALADEDGTALARALMVIGAQP